MNKETFDLKAVITSFLSSPRSEASINKAVRNSLVAKIFN